MTFRRLLRRFSLKLILISIRTPAERVEITEELRRVRAALARTKEEAVSDKKKWYRA